MSSPAGNGATEPLRALALENAAQVARLRDKQIPQHVGMAAASRVLAADLSQALTTELEADVQSGALQRRLEAAQRRVAESGAGVQADPTLAAVVMLMTEQAKRAARYLAVRGEEWAADAYRLEGQASTLETQASRLLHILSSTEVAASGSGPENEER